MAARGSSMKVSGKLRKLALPVFSLGFAYAGFRLLTTQPPIEDEEVGADLETSLETFRTGDGLALKLKRYKNPGGQPVILAHGFLGNGFEFDLPHRDHNLAMFLAERGYDVWISSFRGCGREPYLSEEGDWLHSIDHLAALDAPALIEGVTEATGMRPVWIGHSMGGLVLYMYLQGVAVEADNGGFRVTCDPELARERNESIEGGVAIGSPPSFHFGGKTWIERASRLPTYKPSIRQMIKFYDWRTGRSPKLPASLMGSFVTRFPRVGKNMAKSGPLAVGLYNPDNVHPDVGYSLLKRASDNVSTRMFIQILSLPLDNDYMAYNKEHSYTENMNRITAPLFFITGTEDFAGAENIRTHGYERVSSAVKKFSNLPGYGHTDLVMGKRVREEVYPAILSWIEELPGCMALPR